MASSSSAKKVARVAAKSGSGRPPSAAAAKQRNWLFAVAIVAIVLLGVGVVALARGKTEPLDNKKPPRANLQDGQPYDHWHSAFAIEVCGKELAAVQDGPTDVLGIHTHGDGLIHIHPFTRTASGNRATIGKFFDQTSLTVTDTGFQLPEGATVEGKGTTVKEGVTTCGGKEGELVMAFWKDAKTAQAGKPDKVITKDFSAARFTNDYSAYTLAFVPKGSKDIDPPSSAADIEQLGAADSGGSSAPTGSSDPTGDPTGGATGGGG